MAAALWVLPTKVWAVRLSDESEISVYWLEQLGPGWVESRKRAEDQSQRGRSQMTELVGGELEL